MPFLKVIKNKAYFKRFQVKYRRRREGKTDYRARRKLVTQDKNKYNSPKYRLVVRITNKDVIAQICFAKIDGDHIMTAAYAHELTRYGMPVGHTNYSACYAVGLLVARRLLTKLKLADKYQGQKEVNGEDYNVEELSDGPKPFCALLDVGLRRTTTGAKVFAAMKGACDGGLDIPHSEKRYVGYDDEGSKLNAEVLRKHIFGGHISDYMKKVQDEEPEKYKSIFSQYIKNGLKAESMEATWKKVHAAIRADPSLKKTAVPARPPAVKKRRTRLSLAQRKDRVRQKIESAKKKAQEA